MRITKAILYYSEGTMLLFISGGEDITLSFENEPGLAVARVLADTATRIEPVWNHNKVLIETLYFEEEAE